MKTITIHQPQYLPWLGLLEKVCTSDVYILLDNVQFNKRSFQNRALYSTKEGGKYLTIPVHSKKHQINSLEIKDLTFSDESRKVCNQHFETLRHRYGKTLGWKQYNREIEEFFFKEYDTAFDLIYNSMLFTFELFGIRKEIVRASELDGKGHKNDLLIDLIKKVEGDIYLSGVGAKNYMDEELFINEGIQVIYQQFNHPIYNQNHGGYFVQGCMALEFLLESPNEAKLYMESILK